MKRNGYTSKSRRRQRRVAVVCALVSVLVGGALGFATDGASGAEVSLSVRIRPSVAATFNNDGSVTVHANTPWALEGSVDSAQGSARMFFTGGPTGADGTSVQLDSDNAIVSVVPR